MASQTGNVHYPQYPNFEDFGDVILRGNGGTGYIRNDWFTPDGLSTWGDGRLTILGTDGYIEVRKNVDIAGRPAAAICSWWTRSKRSTSIAVTRNCRMGHNWFLMWSTAPIPR